jgi:hypothetical protein
MKRKLTKADLKKTLAELGFKEGDELVLPSKPNSNEQSESNEEDDDTGGSNPPGNKPKPDKP